MVTVPAVHRGRCDEFSEGHITEMVVLNQVSKLGHNPQPIKSHKHLRTRQDVTFHAYVAWAPIHLLKQEVLKGTRTGQSEVSEAACE